MEYKEIIHNKIEICKLSKKNIDTTKENYSVVLDCSGKNVNSIGFYKGTLISDLIKGNLQKVQKNLTNFSKRLVAGMSSLLGGKKEVYNIQ